MAWQSYCLADPRPKPTISRYTAVALGTHMIAKMPARGSAGSRGLAPDMPSWAVPVVCQMGKMKRYVAPITPLGNSTVPMIFPRFSTGCRWADDADARPGGWGPASYTVESWAPATCTVGNTVGSWAPATCALGNWLPETSLPAPVIPAAIWSALPRVLGI